MSAVPKKRASALIFCILFILVSAAAAVAAVIYAPPPPLEPDNTPPTDVFLPPEVTDTPEPPVETPVGTPAPPADSAREIAESFLSGMSRDEKLWQLFFITPEQLTGYSAVTEAGTSTQTSLAARPVGGLIYFSHNIKTAQQVQTMLSKVQDYSSAGLFLGVDEEGGAVARVTGNDRLEIPPVDPAGNIGATGDTNIAELGGKQIGKALFNLGFNLDFAPVADVLVDPNNKVIGNRSFGGDPRLVADMVEFFIRGLHNQGVAAAVKHFPGLGSVTADPHDSSADCARTLDELRDMEFVPFQRAIDAGAEVIMISHASMSAIDQMGAPAALSGPVIDLLRSELGFDGVIITDSLSMAAVTRKYSPGDAAVAAISAGADMLLMPADLQKSFNALKAAVESGQISESRIDESVLRILTAKVRLGLIGNL
ncbi:MAG: glycoside hydrolase family 3 protein [Oscillospiraceae bacterium]|jgi:beta-N-acetylhexosaminidase|nr:glycoside hydrolase family 3 protein [Oscillospiraceae bacterium]